MEPNQGQPGQQSDQTNNPQSQQTGQGQQNAQQPPSGNPTGGVNEARLDKIEGKVDGLYQAIQDIKSSLHGVSSRLGQAIKPADTGQPATPQSPNVQVPGMKRYVEIRRGNRIIRQPVVEEAGEQQGTTGQQENNDKVPWYKRGLF